MKSESKKKLILFLAAVFLTGCREKINTEEIQETTEVMTTHADEESVKLSGLSLDSAVLPSIEGVVIDSSFEELAPINLTAGVINSVVGELQERLMDLGFMDPDEPTNYYGEATAQAVKYYQRQAGLTEDGITGSETWDSIMSPDAPHYALKEGFTGNDVVNAQYRLYNLGYLSSASEMTGVYDEKTIQAVKKLQELNGLSQDGIYGTNTYNLLYSDEVRANVLALGEQSELVKSFQERLIALGYLSGEADGSFGTGTQKALKDFQSRNDLVVDGYLGEDTRGVLQSSQAKPFAMRIGEQSDSVKKMQERLSSLGYLSKDNATGYFGSITKAAVINFQKNNKLTADGTAGQKTMSLMNSGNAKKASRAASQAANQGVSQGGNGKTQIDIPKNTAVSGDASGLISIASSKLGCPYVWGSKGPNSFDCSGFVYWCLNQAGVGVSYMTSAGWRNPGRFQRVSSYSDLRAGDIIVVSGHVGIVAGGGTVIDASSSNGRVVHRSLGSWWANHFIVGWRIFS